MTAAKTDRALPVLGRYELFGKVASGGMATVYLGRMRGAAGFRRLVAVKRMHPHLSRDREFVAMFLDEAMLAARVQHPNVAATLDVVADAGEMFIVMDYVRGQSLAELVHAAAAEATAVPIPIAVGVLVGALAGLHAAHEARGDSGKNLGIIHRDVSPQNILIGADGGVRLVDFGVAKATSRLQVTRENQLKGKVCYMAPEQLRPGPKLITRATDVFAAGVVLWELLAGRRLFPPSEVPITIARVLSGEIPPLRPERREVTPQLEAVVLRALDTSPENRFPTAEAFAAALEAISPRIASARTIGQWVEKLASDALAKQDAQLQVDDTTTELPSLDTLIRGLGDPFEEPRSEPGVATPPVVDASGVRDATRAAESRDADATRAAESRDADALTAPRLMAPSAPGKAAPPAPGNAAPSAPGNAAAPPAPPQQSEMSAVKRTLPLISLRESSSGFLAAPMIRAALPPVPAPDFGPSQPQARPPLPSVPESIGRGSPPAVRRRSMVWIAVIGATLGTATAIVALVVAVWPRGAAPADDMNAALPPATATDPSAPSATATASARTAAPLASEPAVAEPSATESALPSHAPAGEAPKASPEPAVAPTWREPRPAAPSR